SIMKLQVLFFSLLFSSLTFAQNTNPLSKIIATYEQINQTDTTQLWPDLSESKLAEKYLALKTVALDLQQLNKYELSVSDQINKDLLELIIEDQLFHLQFESHLFPLNSEGGFITGILYRLQYYRVDSETDFQKYLAILRALPDYLQMRKQQMQKGQKLGKSSPRLVVSNCIKLMDQTLVTKTNDSFFLDPVRGEEKQKKEVIKVLEQEVLPAYRNFRQFLNDEYLQNAPENIGISGITNGKKFYEQRTRFFTTFDITPQEVFETGQREVKRIRAEMQQIIDDLGFEGSFADFIAFLRTDEQFYAKTPKALLKEAAWITKRMEGKLPFYFNKFPRMPLTVKPVPAAIAPNYTGGRYSEGSYQQQKAGEYWVNTYKLKSRPLYVLPALSLHEGVPGHHTQIMLAAELENMPDFRRNTYLSAYGEGWALYTEFLGKEAGIYETPYEDFGRLVYEMWRACRLVVDPGMHYMGWTRQQAFDFMASNTALSIHEVNTEIDRYIGWPGQAVSYKMGELKIKELRKLAEEELGADFDIRTFHDLILANGSVPLNTLERLVKTWLKNEK
ncbi:MAG: DUF885 domain-containing protein, partial [Bacteroidota bacterium]